MNAYREAPAPLAQPRRRSWLRTAWYRFRIWLRTEKCSVTWCSYRGQRWRYGFMRAPVCLTCYCKWKRGSIRYC